MYFSYLMLSLFGIRSLTVSLEKMDAVNSLRGLLESRDYRKLQKEIENLELDGFLNLDHPSTETLLAWLLGIYLIEQDLVSARCLVQRWAGSLSASPVLQALARVSSLLSDFQIPSAMVLLQTAPPQMLGPHLWADIQASLRSRLFRLLSTSYSSVSPARAASLLGIPEQSVASFVRERGWDIDAADGMSLARLNALIFVI
jgi:hypothetical protein